MQAQNSAPTSNVNTKIANTTHGLLAKISVFGAPTALRCTALTEVELRATVDDLLDKSQKLSDYLGDDLKSGTSRVNVSQLHAWTSSSHGPVEDAMARGLVPPHAIYARVQDFPSPYEVPSSSKAKRDEEIFLELPQTLAQLGVFWDEGKRVVLLQDEEQTSAIALRVRATSFLSLTILWSSLIDHLRPISPFASFGLTYNALSDGPTPNLPFSTLDAIHTLTILRPIPQTTQTPRHPIPSTPDRVQCTRTRIAIGYVEKE